MASGSIEYMFDLEALAAVDPHADEAALIEQIAWLERVKSAAAAGQSPRGAAALDEKRRADEAAAGVPKHGLRWRPRRPVKTGPTLSVGAISSLVNCDTMLRTCGSMKPMSRQSIQHTNSYEMDSTWQ